MVADRQIGIGFIGCGDVALRSYVPGMAAVSDLATTVAVYDADPARAERLADDLAARGLPQPRVVPTLEALLTDPDVTGVLNLTPAPFHYEVNVAALSAGKHLFTEKPLAGTVPDSRSLTHLANERGLTFLSAPAVMATNRFRWLKQQLDSGWLGRPTLAVAQMANMGPASWRDYKGDPAVFYSASVGPALDTGVYVLHAITGLYGPTKRVEAFGGITIPRRPVLIPRLEGQVIEVQAPDQILIHLDFGENRFGQVLSSFATPRSKAPALELHGERGTVSISQESWYDPDAPVGVWLRDERLGAVADERWTEAKPPGSSRTPHMVQAGPEHFVSVLAGAEPPILTAEAATHVLDIILAAGRSMQEGRAIALS